MQKHQMLRARLGDRALDCDHGRAHFFRMELAYTLVLVAGLLPLAGTVLAKSRMPLRANKAPRAYLEGLEGWRQRAAWAAQNGWDWFPLFAAGVIIAGLQEAAPATVNALAVAFIAFRVVYTATYVADLDKLRSLAWAGGIGCNVALFFV